MMHQILTRMITCCYTGTFHSLDTDTYDQLHTDILIHLIVSDTDTYAYILTRMIASGIHI